MSIDVDFILFCATFHFKVHTHKHELIGEPHRNLIEPKPCDLGVDNESLAPALLGIMWKERAKRLNNPFPQTYFQNK